MTDLQQTEREAPVNEREEPAPAWQKCEKHHITFGMARCPMCAEDDAGYSKSRSPAAAITDAQCLAAFERIYAEADAACMDPDEKIASTEGGSYSLAEDVAMVRAHLVSGRSPAPSEEQEQHDIRVHAEGEQHQIDGICAMFGVEDWRALVELSDALKSGRSPAEVPPNTANSVVKCPTCGGDGSEQWMFDGFCESAWAHQFVKRAR